MSLDKAEAAMVAKDLKQLLLDAVPLSCNLPKATLPNYDNIPGNLMLAALGLKLGDRVVLDDLKVVPHWFLWLLISSSISHVEVHSFQNLFVSPSGRNPAVLWNHGVRQRSVGRGGAGRARGEERRQRGRSPLLHLSSEAW